MRGARSISELDQMHEKKSTANVKNHEDILALLKEIDSLEDSIKTPEPPHEFLEVNSEDIVTKTHEEVDPDSTGLERSLEPTTVQKQVKKQKKRRFAIKFQRKPHIQPKKEFLERNQWIEVPQQEYTTDIPYAKELLPQSTFTLSVDEKGNLVGFHIKKPKEKQERPLRSLLPFKKKEKTETETSQKEVESTGIKGKLIGIIAKLKPKRGEGSEGSKLSGALGKIRGIFSRGK